MGMKDSSLDLFTFLEGLSSKEWERPASCRHVKSLEPGKEIHDILRDFSELQRDPEDVLVQ
jgi:hypothetical protein